jgi:Fe2+ or Zn2+ uptake regulation protein
MVFIALNNENELIFAHNSSKGKYKCIYCNEKIFFVNKSKNDKIAHFKHNILCKYSESINNNYNFYTNEFHFKWTRNLVKPEYLYGYWNNKDIADVINTNKIRIIIRRQLLKENYYTNDENIIWILDGELRNGIIKQITYENNEIKYYFCNDNLYDLKLISSKHKIYIDNGYNQIIEILPENINYE